METETGRGTEGWRRSGKREIPQLLLPELTHSPPPGSALGDPQAGLIEPLRAQAPMSWVGPSSGSTLAQCQDPRGHLGGAGRGRYQLVICINSSSPLRSPERWGRHPCLRKSRRARKPPDFTHGASEPAGGRARGESGQVVLPSAPLRAPTSSQNSGLPAFTQRALEQRGPCAEPGPQPRTPR